MTMIIFLGLVLALLPTYLLRFKILGLPSTVLEVLILVFLFLVVWKASNPIKKIKNLGNINYAIGLFVLSGIISTIISPDFNHALGQLKSFIIEPVLIFYACIVLINRTNVKLVLKFLFWSAVAVSLFGVIQYFTHILLPLRFWGTGLEPKRITSFFEYPNALALYLAPLLGFFFVLWIKNYEFINKKWLATGLVSMLLALILTFSRGAFLAMFLAMLFGLFLEKMSKNKLAIAIVAIVLLALLPQIRQRLTVTDSSTLARKNLLVASIKQIAKNPLVGNGLYGFRQSLEQQQFGEEILNYPHNIIFNFWLELGLFGLLSFIAILYFCYQQYKNQPSVLKLVASVFLLILVLHGLVDVPYFKNDLSVLFWFITSLFYIPD